MTSLYNFNIPSEVYPYSQSSTQSKSGTDWGSQYGTTLLPLLQQSTEQLPGFLSQISPLLQGQHTSLLKKALSPEAFQGTLNQLASRGVLDSSIASDTLSKTATGLISEIGDKAYTSNLQGLLSQAQLPNMFGGLADLLKKTESVSESITEQPLAPYELMANMLMY